MLEVCEEKNNEALKDVLLIRYLVSVGMSCLELAECCDCEKFISHRIVQSVLDDIWSGKVGEPAKKIGNGIFLGLIFN